MNTPNKNKRMTVRFTCDQWEKVRREAEKANHSPSEFVRRSVLGQKIVAASDQDTANELRRIGRMLKGLYPKDAHWPALERAKYWATMYKLFSTAEKLDARRAKKIRANEEGGDVS